MLVSSDMKHCDLEIMVSVEVKNDVVPKSWKGQETEGIVSSYLDSNCKKKSKFWIILSLFFIDM